MTLRNKKSVSLSFDPLEDRTVPAAVANLSSTGVLTIKSDNASDTIRVVQTSTRVDIAGAQYGYNAAAVKQIVVEGNGGNDVIDLRAVYVPCTVRGGDGFDTIFGGQNNDYLDGGNHDDRIWAGGGNDQIFGGAGNDRLFGNEGYDYLYGGTGADFMDDGSRTQHEFYANEADASIDFIADLFAPAGKYSQDHIKQGSQNYTCYFLATIAGMAQAGTNMGQYIEYVGYTNEGVGIYNVSLWNGRQWFKPQVLFAGHNEEQFANVTTDYASWSIIMSKAWNQAYGNRGGFAADAMRALGRNPVEYKGGWTNAHFNAIGTSLSRGYSVVCGTGRVNTAWLEGGHAYQVAATRVVNGVGQVLLRNPWAYDGNSIGGEGSRDGYFWITWGTFVSNMTNLAIG